VGGVVAPIVILKALLLITFWWTAILSYIRGLYYFRYGNDKNGSYCLKASLIYPATVDIACAMLRIIFIQRIG